MQPSNPPTRYPGLAELVQRYDALLVDVWGVLHDGRDIYPEAHDCLRRLRTAGKQVVILTNAGRRASAVHEELSELGIDDGLYDHIVSSGELTWRAITQRADSWHAALGERCFYLGPERSRGMLNDLPAVPVEDLAQADFILNCGPRDNPPSTARYEPLLREAAARGLPMVCANPDQIAVRAGVVGISAGALAKRYQELGSDRVRYHGKPHPEIYRECLELLAPVPAARVLAIGDALETDIAGACRAGLDALLITGGIHREELGDEPVDAAKLNRLYGDSTCMPMGTAPRLRW